MKRNIGCSIAAVFLMITMLITGCGGKSDTKVTRDPLPGVTGATSGLGESELAVLGNLFGGTDTGSTQTDTSGTGGSGEPGANVSVGAEYELVYMSMWGGKASEEDIEVMFPLGIWLKMTPDSANSGTALFNNGGGEQELQYTIDGNHLQMKDAYSTIDAVIRDGFVLIEEPFDTSFNYCFADETADKALVSEIRDGDTNPFDPSFDFTAGGSASAQDDTSAQGASGNSTGGETDFGYDFETAKQYIGDYQGMIIFENGVQFGGYDWSDAYWRAHGRIVINEYGDPLVYLVSDLPEDMNFSGTGAVFNEEGHLYIEGSYADFEWYDLVFPADESGILEIWGRIGEVADEKRNFTVLLKPLGETWDASEVPEFIPADELTVINEDIAAADGMTLEEILQVTQEYWDKKMKENGTEDKKYKMITDELPPPFLLEYY